MEPKVEPRAEFTSADTYALSKRHRASLRRGGGPAGEDTCPLPRLAVFRMLAFKPVLQSFEATSQRSGSMFEVAPAGHDHGDPGLIGGGHDLGVLHRSTRLDRGGHARTYALFEPVRKRKERIGSHD